MVFAGFNGVCAGFRSVIPDAAGLSAHSVHGLPGAFQYEQFPLLVLRIHGQGFLRYPSQGGGAFALGMFLCRYSLEELKNAVGKAWLYVLMVFPVIFNGKCTAPFRSLRYPCAWACCG